MAETKGVLCVTGGTGFIASCLITHLLHRYTVHTTIRLSSGERDISYLTTLPGATDRLRIFEASLEDQVSFLPAIQGCRGVFHVAHLRESRDGNTNPEAAAVEATVGVLRACAESKTVKRVVFTSSIAATVPGRNNVRSDVDETTWTDVDALRGVVGGAAFNTLSVKTATEKAAVEFADRNGMDVVTLLPAFVVGPFICPAVPTSVKLALGLLLGNKGVYDQEIPRLDLVHVEDVVRAHIFVMESPDAKGRYICSSTNITSLEMWEFLSTNYPHLHLPFKDLKISGNGVVYRVSSKKLLDLGFEFKHGLGDMVDGAIQSCKHRGFIS
ncbi:Protein BRI1-5 ENHANCED 1 [Linum perenne]